MLQLAGKRLVQMALIMLTVSILLFLSFEADIGNLATKILGQYSTADQRMLWLEKNGYNEPLVMRYLQWAWNAMRGDFGESLQFATPVSKLLKDHLLNTAILGGLVFAITVSISLVLGVLSGIAEGSPRDRSITVLAVVTTSIPEFASATILVAIFVFWLDWLPGTSPFTNGLNWADANQLVLPVMVLVIYNFGYYTRMTRASMAEVMTSQYVRTAILKGLPYKRVIMRHALRNALIAPFTVMILQLNYLLSGVIVTEVFFSYKGFGKLLYQAATFNDIYVIEACAMVAVFIAVFSQFVSDIGYTLLNPRIRLS
jgi:peptide/nickel transport system permease protein